jgi:hypothetical protein
MTRQSLLVIVSVLLLAPAGACLVSGGDGDPGSSFLAGSAAGPGSGTAGTRSTLPPRSGSAGAGAAGTTGAAGTGAAGTGAAGSGTKPAACTAGATATFELAWTLEDAAAAATTCAAVGAQTVDVNVVNASNGAVAASTVPCSAMMATTCAMPAGKYAVTLTLKSASGATLSEVVAPTLFLEAGQVARPGPIPFQTGGGGTTGRGFALTWRIADADTAAAVTCDAATAKTVRLVAGTKTFDLPCAPGKGRTTAIAPGDYPVTLSLLDAQGDPLSVTGSMTLHVGAGQLIFLGDVIFDVI